MSTPNPDFLVHRDFITRHVNAARDLLGDLISIGDEGDCTEIIVYSALLFRVLKSIEMASEQAICLTVLRKEGGLTGLHEPSVAAAWELVTPLTQPWVRDPVIGDLLAALQRSGLPLDVAPRRNMERVRLMNEWVEVLLDGQRSSYYLKRGWKLNEYFDMADQAADPHLKWFTDNGLIKGVAASPLHFRPTAKVVELVVSAAIWKEPAE